MARMISRQEAATLLNVTAQTISNWVDKGVLNGHFSCDGRKTMLIDRKSIEQYFDSLKDLAFMEKCIASHMKTLEEDTGELEEKLKEMRKVKYLFGNGIPEFFFLDIFNCILSVAGDELLSEREKNILNLFLSGKTASEIGELYYLTSSRIMQIARKSVNRMATMKSWPKVHEDYKRLCEENENLTILLDNQQKRIKDLETKLGYHRNMDSGVSAIPGYTKMELAKVLSRKLVDENLSVRCMNCLKFADIITVRDLIMKDKSYLLKLRWFGKKCLVELEDFLDSLHLSFGMDFNSIIDTEVEYYLEEIERKKNEYETRK